MQNKICLNKNYHQIIMSTLKFSVESDHSVQTREEGKLQVISNVKQLNWNVMFKIRLAELQILPYELQINRTPLNQ